MLQSKESEQAAANMTTTSNNLRREELEYESERGMGKGDRVPLLCLSQKTATKKPVLLLIHDLGKSMYDFLERMEGLARSGYLCCAIDCRHHGGRAQSPRALHNAMRQALLANPSPTTTATTTSSSLFGDSAFDVIALLDYLVKRPDVDPTRIGIFGVGTGGDIALVASAIDCRIRCTAVLPRIFSIGSIVDKGHWESFVTGLKYQSLAYMGDDLSSVFGGAMPSAQEEALHEVLSENRPELVHGTRLGEQEEDDESLRREKREDLKACLEKLSVGITDHFDGKATVAQIVPRPLCLIVEEDKEYIVEEAKRSIGSLPKGLKGDAQLHCVTLSERNKKLGQVDSLVDAFFEKHFLPPPSPKAESSSAIRTCAALGMTRSSDPILSAAKYGAFVACPVFCGKREGYEYEDGNHGLGYYFVGGELQ
jgi:pimeloyl-ACP methyl ester carboxylesterase